MYTDIDDKDPVIIPALPPRRRHSHTVADLERLVPTRSMSVCAAQRNVHYGHIQAQPSLVPGLPIQERSQRSQRAMSMQMNYNPFVIPNGDVYPNNVPIVMPQPAPREVIASQRRASFVDVPAVESLNQIKPSSRKKRRNMSLPTNLVGNNVLKDRSFDHCNVPDAPPNSNEDSISWTEELNVLKEAGFGDETRNLEMLSKFVVRDVSNNIDKQLTQSVVLRMLRMDSPKKLDVPKSDRQDFSPRSAETLNFLENEWTENVSS